MVKKTTLVTTGLILGGSILLLSFLNQRFDILGKITTGGFGIGEAIGGALAGIPIGIGTGGAKVLAEGGAAAGEFFKPLTDFFAGLGKETPKTDVQGNFVEGFSLSELLNKIERNPEQLFTDINRRDVESGAVFTSFKEIFQQSGITSDPSSVGIQPKKGVLDLKKLIADAGARIEAAKASAQELKVPGQVGTAGGPAFGGFKSATEQEAALQATLARSQLLFPQFFK